MIDNSREYWLEQLKEAFPLMDLSYPPDETEQEADGIISINLAEVLEDSIKQFDRQSEKGRVIYMLTVLQSLLYIYSRQPDITVVCPILRSENGTVSSDLFFLRSHINPDLSFKALIADNTENINTALKHQPYCHVHLLDELKQISGLDYSFLYHIGFCDLALQDRDGLNKCDLAICYSSEDGVLQIRYNHKFNKKFTADFATHFCQLVRSGLENEEVNLWQLDLLNDSEKAVILGKASGAVVPTENKMFIDCFMKTAAAFPHNTAVKHNNTALSYEELDEHSSRLAAYIDTVFPTDSLQLIGVYMNRSVEMLIAILAIWKSGNVYVPVNPEYPAERITSLISLDSIKCIICNDTIPDHSLLRYDEGNKWLNISKILEHKNDSRDFVRARNSPEDLAYVIYTSGSTGEPKGVMIEHAGMLNHLQAKVADLMLSEKDAIAQNASQSFDISIWQFLAVLLTGGKTVIIGNDIIAQPHIFIRTIMTARVSVLELVPSYLSVLLDMLMERQQLHSFFLRFLMVTGEEMSIHLVRKWFSLFPLIKLVNAYGPTEAADDITHYIMESPPPGNRVPIGKAIQNMNVYVLDENMALCPVGVKGEICVSGIGVGPGYLNDPEKTARSFMPDPFHTDTDFRLYKTGDIGRYCSDGNLEFFGRRDYQVKIRGHRIELGEIENVLLTIEGVQESVVIDKADRSGNRNLHAFVVLEKSAGRSCENVLSLLKSRLPSFMIPTSLELLERMPPTVNGKIDRKALLNRIASS